MQSKKTLSNIFIILAAIVTFSLMVIFIVGYLIPGANNNSLNNKNSPTPEFTSTPNPASSTAVPTIDPASLATPIPTSAPTPTMAPLKLDEVYRAGDEAYEILVIQNMLTDIGYDPGYADGKYGSNMKQSVEQFQLYAALDDDGVIGAGTLNQLVACWLEMHEQPLQDELPLYGITIGIDAGHQQNGNSAQEPLSPGSSETKAKTSSGTQGSYSEIPEYVINLQVALKLQIQLESLGADVVMTRTSHVIDLSNAQRAQMMNENQVDCWIRIHANGSSDEDIEGMFMLTPAQGCMDTENSDAYEASAALAETLLRTTLAATGAKSLGITERNDITGFNWSQVPVCLIEMGHMTNEKEDYLLVTNAYQQKIIDGLVDGLIEYFTDETY